jgi:hypothetical protein
VIGDKTGVCIVRNGKDNNIRLAHGLIHGDDVAGLGRPREGIGTGGRRIARPGDDIDAARGQPLGERRAVRASADDGDDCDIERTLMGAWSVAADESDVMASMVAPLSITVRSACSLRAARCPRSPVTCTAHA